MDEYFVDGGVYWFRLQVLPDAIGANSGSITFRVPSKGTAPTSTTRDVKLPTAPGSTVVAIMTGTSSSTAFESETSLDIPKDTVRYHKELSSSDGLGPTSSVMAAIAMGGGVLGICLFVLLGLFIYRKRKPSTGDSAPGGDEAASGNPTEQQGDKDTTLAEPNAFTPKLRNDGIASARGHTVVNGNFHEMA